MLLAIRPGGLFWSNTLSVLQNTDFHIKPWKCDLKNTPSLLANVTLCYRPLPWEVYFWTTVHHICRIMFFATTCGSVVLNNTPSLCACWHQIIYVKLDFDFSDGQQYRDLGMSISNYPHKTALLILQRSIVSQSVHVDIEIPSYSWSFTFLTINSIAIKACWYPITLIKLHSKFCNGHQYRNLYMSISRYLRKVEASLFWRSTVSQSRHVDIKLPS